ncbi:MAG: hypothetical protein JSW39_27640 [Desulfobacterales bacterium]|nr:MAG: hypothetical protein JSW39_27640 [Desulfobacterales bacterium]
MNFYETISTMTIVFVGLAAAALFVIAVGFFYFLKLYRNGVALIRQAQQTLLSMEKQMLTSLQNKNQALLNNALDEAVYESAEIDSYLDSLANPTRSVEQMIAEAEQIELAHTEDTPREDLAEIIDDQMEPMEDEMDEHAKNAEANWISNPDVQAAILKYLEKKNEPTNYRKIMNHLSADFPDTDFSDFMNELDELEGQGKIAVKMVSGRLFFQSKKA